jgi:hypothetical protein
MYHDEAVFSPKATNGNQLSSEDLPFAQLRDNGTTLSALNMEIAVGPEGTDRRWIQINGSPIFGENGDIDGAVLNLRPLSDEEIPR